VLLVGRAGWGRKCPQWQPRGIRKPPPKCPSPRGWRVPSRLNHRVCRATTGGSALLPRFHCVPEVPEHDPLSLGNIGTDNPRVRGQRPRMLRASSLGAGQCVTRKWTQEPLRALLLAPRPSGGATQSGPRAPQSAPTPFGHATLWNPSRNSARVQGLWSTPDLPVRPSAHDGWLWTPTRRGRALGEA